MNGKPSILVTGNLPGAVLDFPREDFQVDVHAHNQRRSPPRKTLPRRLSGKAGLIAMITGRHDGEGLDHAPQPAMAANMGVGCNNIDVEAESLRAVLRGERPPKPVNPRLLKKKRKRGE